MTWGHAVKPTIPRGDLLRDPPSGVPLGMDGGGRRGRARPHERWDWGPKSETIWRGGAPPVPPGYTVTILSPVAIGWYMVSVVRPAA